MAERVLCLRFPAWGVQRVLAERTAAEEAPQGEARTEAETSGAGAREAGAREDGAHAAAGGSPPRATLMRRRDARRGDCVAACCSLARRAGVRPGMPLSEALALVAAAGGKGGVGAPAADVWPDDPEADQRALERLAEALERFSPIVGWELDAGESARGGGSRGAADDADRSLWLDVTGIGGLFGGEGELLYAAREECRRRGYRAYAALAPTVGAAWAGTWLPRRAGAEEAAARREHAGPVLTEADVRGMLADAPLRALRIDADAIETLRHLGVTRIGQLERLPRSELVRRFGPELSRRLDQLHGVAAERVRPFRPPPACVVERSLDEPTRDERVLGAVLRELLGRIADQLAPRAHGVLQLAVRLDVAGGPPRCVRLDLFRPSASPRHWEELVRLRWERLDGAGPVGRVTVEAAATAPCERRQQALFATEDRDDPREWGRLLERLTSRLGGDAVSAVALRREGLPERDYEYRPWLGWRRAAAGGGAAAERVRATRAAVRRPGRGAAAAPEKTLEKSLDAASAAAPRAVCYRPLRVDPRPRPLEVVAVAPYGPPASFRWEGTWRRIARWWGPERIETGWWRGPSARRDYYRVETEAGERWWIFRDLADGAWRLHGSFD